MGTSRGATWAGRKDAPKKRHPVAKKGGSQKKPVYCRSLGLKAADRLAAVDQVERGLAASKVAVLAKHSGLSTTHVLKAARIPTSTMARRLESGVLSPEESDRLLRLAQVVDEAMLLFDDDHQRVAAWLQRANVSLDGRTPLDLLGADAGVQEVRHLIGRVMHGVPA